MEHVRTDENERTDNELLDVIYEPFYESPAVNMAYNHNLPVIQIAEGQQWQKLHKL